MNPYLQLDIDQGIARVTFNRPESMNAMDVDAALALRAELERIGRDDSIRAVLLRGAGNAFHAGGDVSVFHRNLDGLPPLIVAFAREFHYAILAMRRMPKPVLASVHGTAAGAGVSLVAAADVAIAAESTRFTLAYSRIGASPDGGSTWLLPRLVGARKALEMALLPDLIDARTALAAGLLNEVVPDAELAARTDALLQRLAQGPTRAFAETKALINQAFDVSLETQLEAEAQAFARCAATADLAEGVTAFVEKRRAKFEGR